MPRTNKSPDQTIAELQAAKEKIDKKIRQARGRQRAQERRDDTREKIILGAIVSAHMECDSQFMQQVMRAITKFQGAPRKTRDQQKVEDDIAFLQLRWSARDAFQNDNVIHHPIAAE